MSRTFTATAIRELLAQNSGEVFLVLLTLAHSAMSTIRVVGNTVGVTSRGNAYAAYPFEIDLPRDLSDQLPQARLTISNVDRMLIDELRAIATPIAVTMEIIAASAPDAVEVGPYTFDLIRAEYGLEQITGTLSFEPILSEPYPADLFDPKRFAGLFGRLA